mmetsp:Transcript_8672/g.27671  ORF Transcript_8672/g.27671 Transcript_8672/m.27671 type:complete len:316 (-) Transcript_8672:2728-3675(-)
MRVAKAPVHEHIPRKRDKGCDNEDENEHGDVEPAPRVEIEQLGVQRRENRHRVGERVLCRVGQKWKVISRRVKSREVLGESQPQRPAHHHRDDHKVHFPALNAVLAVGSKAGCEGLILVVSYDQVASHVREIREDFGRRSEIVRQISREEEPLGGSCDEDKRAPSRFPYSREPRLVDLPGPAPARGVNNSVPRQHEQCREPTEDNHGVHVRLRAVVLDVHDHAHEVKNGSARGVQKQRWCRWEEGRRDAKDDRDVDSHFAPNPHLKAKAPEHEEDEASGTEDSLPAGLVGHRFRQVAVVGVALLRGLVDQGVERP